MEMSTVSAKYQVVLPKHVRESLGIKQGSKVMFLELDGQIILLTPKDPRTMKGFLKGTKINFERENEDRY